MNRSDFLIRTLSYYAKMSSPHPVYIADSSNPEDAEKIKKFIEKIKTSLEVHYNWFIPGFDNSEKLLRQVQERYAVINGDDDYEIPSSLTLCAQFLENNPDYASASGHSVSFRLTSGGPYGKIKRLTDYPMHSLEAETASQKLLDFMRNPFTTTSGVNRVEHMRKIWVGPIPIVDTWNELFQVCYCAISGKSKVLDCLGIVRHIHDRQYYASAMVDWITDSEFHSSYIKLRDHLAQRISEIDSVTLDEARKTIKDAFWEYLQVYMSVAQKSEGRSSGSKTTFKTLRSRIGTSLPFLKVLYRKYIRRFFNKNLQIHYEVLQPGSEYYKDFKPVMDSFTKKA